MMTLKEGKGKVPIQMDGPTPYILVDFPTREMFDSIYTNHQHTTERKDKYFEMLTARSQGAKLDELANRYSITRERVRQIEGKFIRQFSRLLKKDTSGKTN
jgi:DNA-directed RNA polymerase sigma subunit (sigma70/sigma32)